jgi:signal transduction histidine kinase
MDTRPAAGVQTAAAVQPVSQYEGGALLRTVAHELRQPLSAIDSISYYLDLVLPRGDNRARDQASRLHALVQQSCAILSCALDLSDTRPIEPQWVSLEELLTQAVVAARNTAQDTALRLELSGDLPPVSLDPQRGSRMMEHLLILFLPLSNAEHPVRIRTSLMEGTVLLEASLSPAGTASGPTSANANSEAATGQGSFSFQVDPAIGARARLLLPVATVK